ncbi:MAG: pyridoxamine 5'-phosphate oxidase family protein, partial [Candidatus Pacebacteria bacterium]|nr:pyridoxamine 5'-phosphate oxidase family protein [Candidatus Paceibacterota bacterium]
MNFTEKQKDLLFRRPFVVLATSSLYNDPRAIIVEVDKAEDGKLIITDNQMVKTRENILENKNVFLLAFEEDYSYCLKIKGSAKYFTEGEHLDFVKSLETNEGYSPKGVIIVDVEEVI